MKYALRMTEADRNALRSHLFPGDGKEAAALLLCGRRNGAERHIFTVRRVIPVPHEVCDRRPDRVTWPTDFVDALLQDAYGKEQAIVKVHSHPMEYRRFSSTDDQSDQSLFGSVTSLLEDELPHASVIMLPEGDMIGRVLGEEGKILAPLSVIMAVGDEIRIWTDDCRPAGWDGFALRHAQAFGSGTTAILRGLAVAVIGCSGTGSIVVEQLARLGVGRLVLVDPDTVEEKNLNRILNSGKEDAYLKRPKVKVLATAIARMGLGHEVIPLHANLVNAEVVKAVAECDIVFGCMDGVEGRHLLNRLAVFYTMPYFDVGVRLDGDGKGGIDHIGGATHYLQPGGSSLLSRGVYDLDRVNAEEIRRTDPELYRRRIKEGYLRGVEEDRPAVVSLNMFFAALVVNDFLARIHPYRNTANGDYACISASLAEVQFYPEGEAAPCQLLDRHVGRGDVTPLLDRPALS
jgi:ThiF family/Prokaryotic homologs of the JAB domain